MSTQEILQQLYIDKGELTPELVVEQASDPQHELHDRFEWNDSEAARKFRLRQAAGIIRSVRITVERGEILPPIKVRAFISSRDLTPQSMHEEDDEPINGSYLPVEEVVLNDRFRTAWLASLTRDWHALKRRAANSRAFADMVRAELEAGTA